MLTTILQLSSFAWMARGLSLAQMRSFEGDRATLAATQTLAREATRRALADVKASYDDDLVALSLLGVALERRRRPREATEEIERLLGMPKMVMPDVAGRFKLQRIHILLDQGNGS